MAGKGDRRRPTLVPKEVADANYENIFGKYVPTYMRKMIGTGEEALDAYNEENKKSIKPKEEDK
jgi:hypothetical protein